MMLDGAGGIRVVGQAADGSEVPGAVAAHHPDVVLMDLRMPRMDGITATRRLRSGAHPPDVIVLTTFDADDDVLAALQAGATGYLLKDTPPARIVEAIVRVSEGDPILSASVTRRLMQRAVDATGARVRARQSLGVLTDREADVVAAIARGASNADIAAELYMSVATVKAHVTRILGKLGLTNRTQVALLAHAAERT